MSRSIFANRSWNVFTRVSRVCSMVDWDSETQNLTLNGHYASACKRGVLNADASDINKLFFFPQNKSTNIGKANLSMELGQ